MQFILPKETISRFCFQRPNQAFPETGLYPEIHCSDRVSSLDICQLNYVTPYIYDIKMLRNKNDGP